MNPNLARNSVGEWDWSRRGAWIARVRPTDLERDLAASCTREVVVASSDSHASAGIRQALGLLGCRVTAAQGCSATLESLRASGADLVLIDAPSLQREGPALVESINTFCPDARVVVVEDPDSPRESAYRSLRILFYAVRPLNYQELIDILETAFHSPERLLPAPSSANYLPKAAHCIRFTDRQGCAVSLIASGSILNPGSGLGRCLIEHLLREGYPVEVDYGGRIHGPRHLLEARENNGLVVELKAWSVPKITRCSIQSR